MAEGPDAFIFVGELDYEQPMLGLDDLATGIEDLGPIAEDTSSKVTAALSGIDEAINADDGAVGELDGSMGGLGSALSSIIEYLDILAETSINTLDTVTNLSGSMGDLAASMADTDAAVSDEDSLLASLMDMLKGAADAALNLGASMEEGMSAMSDFGGGIGNMLAIMAGFAIFNDASKAIDFWGQSMIGGNATLQQFNMQLTALMGGNSSAAQQLLNWSYQFGLQVPDTTQNLQQAIVTIQSLGVNAQQLMPSLADVAAAMGTKLPTAAQAFLDAFEGRFFMMQRQLRISKEELEKFGLQLDKHGKVIQSTLIPAFEKLVAAKYPDALANAMQTWNGAMANATDLLQQLAMHFGQPVFKDFLGVLLAIEQSVGAHKQEWFDMATAIGTDLGNAVSKLITLLTVVGQYLIQHHDLLIALASAFGGVLVGALSIALSGIAGFLIGMAPFVVVFGAVGAAAALVAQAFMRAYKESASLRAWLGTLGDAFHTLLDAIAPLIERGFKAFEGEVTKLSGALTKFFTSQQFLSFIDHLAQGIYGLANALQHPQTLLAFLHDHLSKIMGVIVSILPVLGGLGGGFGLVALGGVKPLVGVLGDALGIFPTIIGLVEKIGGVFAPTTGILLQASLIWAQLSKWLMEVAFHANAIPLGMLRLFADGIKDLFLGGLSGGMGTFVTHLVEMGSHIDKLGSLLEPVFGKMATLLGSGIRNAILGLPELFSSLGTSIMGSIMEAIAAFGPLIGVVLLVVGIVYSLIAAFIYFWNTSAGFRAAIAGIGQQFMQLGALLVSTLLPVWNQLQTTLKTQFIPAWNDLKVAFNELQPVFIFIGAIIMGVLAVALGLLIGIIKGVITALGPVLTGIIEIFGGIATFIAGWAKLIGDFVSGWLNFFNDLFHGHFTQAYLDITTMWRNIWNDVLQILSGIWQMIVGLLTGFFGGIWGLLSGFVSGVIGFFQMLADKLVGHSIWPDMLNSLIDHLGQFVINVENRIAAWVIAIIAHFASLAMQALNEFSAMENMLFAAVDNLVNRIPGQFQTLVNDIINVLGQLPQILFTSGQHMIDNFVNGITSKIGAAKNAASGIAQGIAGVLHFTVPEEGPLSDADQWMDHFGTLLSDGMQKQEPLVSTAAGNLGQTQRDTYLAGLGVTSSGGPTVDTATAAFPVTAGASASGSGSASGTADHPIVVDFRSNNSMALQTLLGLLSPSDRQAFAEMIGKQMGQNANLQYITDRGYAG